MIITQLTLDELEGFEDELIFVQEESSGKKRSSKKNAELFTSSYLFLDLRPGHGNLFGPYWEMNSPYLGDYRELGTGPAPYYGPACSGLSEILEPYPDAKYNLSKTACLGILRRSLVRGKELPPQLKQALMVQAELYSEDELYRALPELTAMRDTEENGGCLTPWDVQSRRVYEDSGVWPSLYGGDGDVCERRRWRMKRAIRSGSRAVPAPDSFRHGNGNAATGGGHGYISEKKENQPDQEPCPVERPAGFDGYNGDLTGNTAAILGASCGMSTGRNGILSFAINQRDEARDLGSCSAALQAQPGMKQQTFVAQQTAIPVNMQIATRCNKLGEGTGFGVGADGDPAYTLQEAHSHGIFIAKDEQIHAAGVVTKGNGDCFLTPEAHTALSSGGGQAGQGYPCVMTAGFCAGAAPSAGGIGYQEECAPTMKAGGSGTNMVPAVICLNDQGGQRMDIYENMTGTLRSKMDGHPPLVLEQQRDEDSPAEAETLLFENHGIDSRYKRTEKQPVSTGRNSSV